MQTKNINYTKKTCPLLLLLAIVMWSKEQSRPHQIHSSQASFTSLPPMVCCKGYQWSAQNSGVVHSAGGLECLFKKGPMQIRRQVKDTQTCCNFEICVDMNDFLNLVTLSY